MVPGMVGVAFKGPGGGGGGGGVLASSTEEERERGLHIAAPGREASCDFGGTVRAT